MKDASCILVACFLVLGFICLRKYYLIKEYYTNCNEPISFVPMEDRIVPTHASYSNRMNDVIGNINSGEVNDCQKEVVVASDWYMNHFLPTEFDGNYWPTGSVAPTFLYPGADPERPLRKQTWPAYYGTPSTF